MNFSSMEYFIALAEERSFTRAAQRLMVTQQTLSAHIAGIERELGVRLVNRKVPLTLTYAGEVLLSYARRFETDRRAMEQEFADIAGDAQGLLGVGIASTRGRLLMPRATFMGKWTSRPKALRYRQNCLITVTRDVWPPPPRSCSWGHLEHHVSTISSVRSGPSHPLSPQNLEKR